MEGVIGVHSEPVRGDEHRAGGAQGDVAATLSHHAGAYCRRRIVSGAGCHLCGFRKAGELGNLRQHRAYTFIAFKEPGHLGLFYAADAKHFLTPALVLHIQKEHTGGIGVVAAVDTG